MIAFNLLRNFYVRLNWWRLRKKLLAIELVILDVDGVLTDGGLWYGPNKGELMKRFDVRDGLGIRLMQHIGIEVVFLSGGQAGSTNYRASDLGIKTCITGAKDKPLALRNLCEDLSIPVNKILFVGDDLNDLSLKGEVGILVAPADAVNSLKVNADLVLKNSGGHGAVRELAEGLIKCKGIWSSLNNEGWRDRND